MPHYNPKMYHHMQLTSSPSWNCHGIDLLKLKEKKKKPFIYEEHAKNHIEKVAIISL